MKENKPDKRTVITKRILKDCLIRELKEKPLHEITVKELCEISDLNRSTFYRHYESVNALYEEILADAREIIMSGDDRASRKTQNPIAMLEKLFEFAESNRERAGVLIGSDCDGFQDIIDEITMQIIIQSGNPDTKGYYRDFISAGIGNILKNWLISDSAETAMGMAIITNAIISQGLKNILNILPKK